MVDDSGERIVDDLPDLLAGIVLVAVGYALFDSIGSTAFLVVFLMFLDAALDSMRLTALSSLIENGAPVFPSC